MRFIQKLSGKNHPWIQTEKSWENSSQGSFPSKLQIYGPVRGGRPLGSGSGGLRHNRGFGRRKGFKRRAIPKTAQSTSKAAPKHTLPLTAIIKLEFSSGENLGSAHQRWCFSPFGEKTLRWLSFSRQNAYNSACLNTNGVLRQALEALATALAGYCYTNQRETVLLTALFPEAANAEESHARCLRLRATLEEAFPELQLDLLLSTLEVHRVLGEAREEKPEPRPLRTFSENPLQAAVKLQQMKTLRAETTRAEQLVAKRNLQGHHHLHALVVLGWQDLVRLRLALWEEREGLDLSLVVVGGGSRELREYKAPLNPEGYRKQLYATLYYLFKEYRIESREELFQTQLPAALNQKGTCFKMQLIWNRSLVGPSRAIPELVRLLESLEKVVPGFNWRSLDLGTLVLPSGGLLVTQLKALMEHFLRKSNMLLWVNRFTRGSKEVCITRLVQPSAAFFHGVLQHWESSAEEVLERVSRFYGGEDDRGVDLLTKHRASFVHLYNCGNFSTLDQSLMINKVGQFMTLRDGSVLSWANGEVLLTSYEEIQRLRRWQSSRKELNLPGQSSTEHFSEASVGPAEVGFTEPAETYPDSLPREGAGELLHRWGSGEIGQSWFELQQRNLRGTQLRMLRRILHHSQKTRAENQSRVVDLLRELGETLRANRQEGVKEAAGKKMAHGFFFWGESGTGKTQLAHLLGGALRGDGEAVALGLDNFGQDIQDTASVLMLDDLTPRDKLFRLKPLISNSEFRVQRKHRGAVAKSFGHMPVFITSNYSRDELLVDYPADRGPFNRRFPVQLELVMAPLSRNNPEGWELLQLEKEMGEIMVYALYFSDRRVKAQRASELRKLLQGVPLGSFSEAPGADLKNYLPEFTEELEKQMAQGHCYLFAQEPHKGRFVSYPDRGYDPDRAKEPQQVPAEEIVGELVFETVSQWEDFVTFAPTGSEEDSEGESGKNHRKGPKKGQKFITELPNREP